jgi:hypothetical protein
MSVAILWYVAAACLQLASIRISTYANGINIKLILAIYYDNKI